jgi:phosphatidylserine/phosphatidylglycerophosphate/cardiolipin synthase-like enzyme
MKNIKLLPVVILFFSITTSIYAQKNITNYIKCYFTQPVDNTLSTGVKAVYCNNSIFDTLAAYINKAKYTIDIAQYEWITLSGTDPIQTAITAANKRGVKIRYIEDYSYSTKNKGVQAMPKTIPFLISPKQGNASCTTSNGSESYNIMHNKFVIIDEYNPDSTGVWVWTGSPDWDDAMSSCDYNNVIVFQSKVLARAFTHEFNIMWGDTTHGGAADSTKALFGSCKPNSGTHHFTIGGSKVDLYFSPSDSVNNQIVKTIGTATVDEYCGMFTFTETTDATDIVNQKKAGATAYVILDNFSSGSYTPYTTTFPNGLGSNFHGFVSSSCLYHNKYIIVNPSAPCDDPKVLTGSHNWTSSADAENDENTVIVHNDTIANEYLQSFGGDFKTIGGASVVPPKNPCPGPTGINSIDNTNSTLDVFPNPYNGSVHINYTLSEDTKVTMCVYNIMGEKVATLIDGNTLEAGQHTYQFNGNVAGIYILQVIEGSRIYTRKLVQE